jgi:two-component system alkaline phosphatase synthesis response regulator PhoP
MTKILIVEDEKILRETLAYNLTSQGFELLTSGNGNEALEIIRLETPDLMILDIMLPGMDGFEICRQVRTRSNIPILMLTARDSEIDRVVGLEVGADDYLVKPFSMRELVARVKAMLRRGRFLQEEDQKIIPVVDEESSLLIFKDLSIDLDRREILKDGKVLQVRPKEFELFFYMAQNRGKALSRDRILQEVWGWNYVGESRTVDVHIRWLRQIIEDDPANPTRLVTVRGSGYMFEG